MAPDSPQQFPDDPDVVEIRWYARFVRRHWRIALAAGALGGALGFGYTALQPPVYEGVTTLLVVPRTLPSGVQINPPTFSSIARSGTLVAQVIDELKLQNEVTPQAFLERALEIEEVSGTNIVRIKVRLDAPKAAAEASRRLAAEAVGLTQQMTEDQGASALDQLKHQVSESSDRLQKVEEALLTYKRRVQPELLRRDADTLLKERADLMQVVVDLAAERARLATAEQEFKRQAPVLSMAGAPAGDELAPRSIANPVYVALDSEIATSRAKIAALERQQDDLMNVRKVGGKELAKLSELYQGEVELARLQADVDLARRLYDDVALRYEQSRAEPLITTPPLQILDNALPPDRPISRKRLQYGLAGAAAGVAGALLVALMWESQGRRRPSTLS